MSTLLKSKLLKTNNPFIMFKCYLDDLLKSDKTWEDLLEDMDDFKPSDKGKEKSIVKIDPALISSLKALMKSNPELFRGGKLLTSLDSRKETGESNTRISPSLSIKPTTLDDNTFNYKVRHTNLLGFRDSLKSSKLFSEDPSTLKPIIEKLNDLISKVSTHQSTKQPSAVSPDKTKVKSLEAGLKELRTVHNRLKDADFDMAGKLIYDSDTEDLIFGIINSNEQIAQLRRLSEEPKQLEGDSEYGKLRMDLFNLLNKPTKYNTIEGIQEGKLSEAIIDAYTQKTGVSIARQEQIAQLRSAQRTVHDAVNTGGKRKLEDIMADPTHIAASKKRRESKRQREITDATEEVEEERADSLIAELMREGSVTIN